MEPKLSKAAWSGLVSQRSAHTRGLDSDPAPPHLRHAVAVTRFLLRLIYELQEHKSTTGCSPSLSLGVVAAPCMCPRHLPRANGEQYRG
jgi:hypothetical protein